MHAHCSICCDDCCLSLSFSYSEGWGAKCFHIFKGGGGAAIFPFCTPPPPPHRSLTDKEVQSCFKYVFKVETKIGTKYSNSPYYKGTLLWDKLDKETQDLECLVLFKKNLDTLYNKFDVKMII